MSIASLARSTDSLNLAEYPLNQDGPARQRLVQTCREGLRQAGVFVLPNFVSAQALARLQTEVPAALPTGRVFSRYRTSYQSRDVDQKYPLLHPRNIAHLDRYRVMKQSTMPPDCRHALEQIYHSDDLLKFLSDVMERPLQRVELGDQTRSKTTTVAYEGITVNLQEHGDSLLWHFDNNDFVVTIGIERPSGGGQFQYVPFIRSDEDEHYDDVMSVFLGEHPDIRNIVLEPGTLVGFAGRRSIHRVAPVYGKGRRLTAILLFNDVEGEASRASSGEFRIGGGPVSH
jgi:hypothetical protein